ncbi:MAG: hypothetical protein FWD36_04605 [Treponema sp.]|nr:hypothetical protein [Treponema sp.]
MKKYITLILLLAGIFPLFAQNQHVSIHVPAVNGTGSTKEDNEAFREFIVRELRAWDFTLAQTLGVADYSMPGMLQPNPNSPGGFVFSLALLDSNDVHLYEETLYYRNSSDARRYISTMVSSLFFYVLALDMQLQEENKRSRVMRNHGPPPGKRLEDEAWRNKLLYLGGSIFWAPRVYTAERKSWNLSNVGVGFSAEYNFIPYLSVDTGFEFVPDWIAATPQSSEQYRNVILQIPIAFSFVMRPSDRFMHKLYAGILFNAPLLPASNPPLLSWNTGFQYGVKASRGIAFADTSFSMDMGKSGLDKRTNDPRQYNRYMFYLGIGYKWGLVDRKAKEHKIETREIQIEVPVIQPPDIETEA